VIYKDSHPNTTGKLNVIDKFIRNYKNENSELVLSEPNAVKNSELSNIKFPQIPMEAIPPPQSSKDD
jgi:hypothetical protein